MPHEPMAEGGEMKTISKVQAINSRTILIVLDVLAALAYLPVGDWRKVVYWLAAATLTYVVTY